MRRLCPLSVNQPPDDIGMQLSEHPEGGTGREVESRKARVSGWFTRSKHARLFRAIGSNGQTRVIPSPSSLSCPYSPIPFPLSPPVYQRVYLRPHPDTHYLQEALIRPATPVFPCLGSINPRAPEQILP